MRRRLLIVLAAFALLAAGVFVAVTFAVGETTGTVTAAVPDRVVTIPGTTNITTYTVPTVTETQTVTVTQPPPPPPPPPAGDPIAFPRNAEYLSFDFDNGANTQHFQMNVMRGCNPGNADKSFALNPKQVNFVVPGKLISSDGVAPATGCPTAGTDFAVSFGGYDSLTSPIVSPYPGIGTIRAFDGAACPNGDYSCFTDNTRITAGGQVLDFTSTDTADWGAKVRAHFYQEQLKTGSHPGVMGIFGDYFIWSRPYFDAMRSAGGAAPAGSDQARDDGAIENATKLSQLLPGKLMGANGAGSACGFGDTYQGSVAGAECSSVGDTTMFENYIANNVLTDPARFDSDEAQIVRWLSTPANDGNPKRAIITGCGLGPCSSPLGHVYSAREQRESLALADLTGAYLWVVNGNGWNTSAIPGTASGANFAIPEMGDTAAFPRGWLGQPAGSAQKFASGQWKRVFSGGIVYANATMSAWSIDGRTVPARDGLFVRT
jgi:hypothetical protein